MFYTRADLVRRKIVEKRLIYSLLCVGVCFLLVSCGEPVGGSGQSAVFLSAQAADPYAVACDVYNPSVSGNVALDVIHVIVKSVYRDPSGSTTSNFADVLLKEQRVTYTRYDGNPDVPEPFVVVLPNNPVPNGGELDLEILIVRADAKLESPLKELAFGGGEGEILLTGHVEFYGEDLAGNSAYCSIEIPIIAKDY
ncbi:hypothetical protein CSA56_01105 [candidate division KSB3 bacterium]|uniref:Uncharacterized protein n=1 Tax=candidate division KSB3 bacterium TaxID=2044937 RepID=A0A2G6KMA9_9BACT|nr:MAG: hypothetical protein CSA56_01105 [candidate division KSB3 bacterium]